MTVHPIARPSRPSVRFTAFDEPAITNATKNKNGKKANGQTYDDVNKERITKSGCTRWKNGKTSCVEYLLQVANTSKPMPQTMLTRICSENFFALVSPRLRCLETFA